MITKVTGFFTVVILMTGLLLSIGSSPIQAMDRNDMQITVSGTVYDANTGNPLTGVNVTVQGRVIGTSTNANGEFNLRVNDEPPITLVISIIGYISERIEITENNVTDLRIKIEEQTILGSDVVVSASRVEESILDAPISIEKIDAIGIQQAAAPSFYDAIANLKGVDFSSQSMTFKSVNMRGFAANGNLRFVQHIDGIDNQAPGLNFPVGNIVGISDLDLESAELIPGVASALYGPNAINGILLMNSKSPFEYQGFSAMIKSGVNHIDSRDDDPSMYNDFSVRYANAINDRLAFKVNASYLRANDFRASDRRDTGPATFGAIERGDTERGDNRVYSGLNVYGQPLLTIGNIADGVIAGGGAQGAQIAAIRPLLPDGEAGAFTPDGFVESSFVDNTTESLKLGAALHYRLADRYELLGQFNWGNGSTVYTANDRFILDDFIIWTAKLELQNPNYYVRAYTTQENSGDTYAANTVASRINERTFIPAYFQTFAGARTQGATIDEAHAQARSAGRNAQPQPGSEEFDALFNEIRDIPISEGGAKFLDRTGMWHAEGQYSFRDIIDPDVVDVIAGANVRRFTLNSEGTLFALDEDGNEFNLDEFGAYVQLSKSVLDDRLDLQGSLRYDKHQDFSGQFSPRASAVYSIANNQNIRASYQRGFRIPSTQNQLIDLDVVARRLLGNNRVIIDRYLLEENPVYRSESVEEAREALATGASAQEARNLLEGVDFEPFRTEKVTTFELGYKSLIRNRLFLDAYYYYNIYEDFIAEIEFMQGVPNGIRQDPGSFDGGSADGQDEIINQTVATQRFGININADGTVRSHGFAVGAEYSLPRGYNIGGNVSFNELISQQDLLDQGFRASFNTPKYRYNLSFANRRVTQNIGFNMTWRWQDAFQWESTFGEGVIPAFGTMDAQVSFRLPAYNSILKFGGSNVLNNRYETSIGNPTMGAIYYVSLTFDQLLN
ncbi:TonB-dependent receptor [Rhodohalobacter sp. SW132]|uniref:TonB-dependent receptor n=1 Tax=Rhodohalobacter sp. SW132 TaxID=2293433 RepID=UPI001F4409F3|nr:TonB-dependent receptor [Rhodohalobacter sp. SW132]